MTEPVGDGFAVLAIQAAKGLEEVEVPAVARGQAGVPDVEDEQDHMALTGAMTREPAGEIICIKAIFVEMSGMPA